MKLLTIQDRDRWEEAKRIGYLTGGAQLPKGHTFAEAYAWMCEQMRRRIPDYSGDYPVWAWPLPLCSDAYEGSGRPGEVKVALYIEIPDHRVLLSDFAAWHQVINKYAILEQEDYSQQEMEESWQRIFGPLDDYWSKGLKQACIDRVRLDEVILEEPFIVPRSDTGVNPGCCLLATESIWLEDKQWIMVTGAHISFRSVSVTQIKFCPFCGKALPDETAG